MKVYIAAPYPERNLAIAVMRALEAKDVEVTSSWLKIVEQNDSPTAQKDLADVAACDVLLAINPPAWANAGTGGRHVELGYAIALNKKIVLAGDRTNIFHYLDHVVRVFSGDPEVIASLITSLTFGARC